MIASFIILFILICIIAGLNGMPFLFMFPVGMVVIMLVAHIYKDVQDSKHIPNEKEEKELEEHIMFTEIDDKH